MLSPQPSALSPFSLTRSPRRKRSVALHVEKDGTLSVQAPVRTSLKWIEAFIAQKASWIEKRRQEIAARHAAPKPALKNGSEVVFMGRKLRLVIFPASFNNPRHCERSEAIQPPSLNPRRLSKEQDWIATSASPPRNDDIEISGLDELHLAIATPPDSPEHSEEINLAFRLWAKKEARRYLPQRTVFWAAQTGLTPARVIVSAPEKRWGSCSAHNEVRLNWRLILSAPEIIDYVIIHELAHIKHKHHGPRFWQRVEKHIPDYKERRKTLRNAEKQGH